MEKSQQSEYLKIIVVAVIAGAVGMGLGMKLEQRKLGALVTAGSFMNGGSGRTSGMMGGNTQARGNRGGFRPVSGEIISQDDKSITVKLTDGSSKIVLLGSSTTINKADTATKSDLVTGKKVAVFGSENSDGSVTASSIQLDPIALGMGMMRGATPSASEKPTAY